MIAREYTRFLGEMVCHPRVVGAFGPSSANLARHMVNCVEWTHADDRGIRSGNRPHH